MAKKYVYLFKEGNAKMRNILGGKGANLAEMSRIGLPVPQGFTVSAEVCNLYYNNNEQLPQEVINQIDRALEKVQKQTGKAFGDPTNPLLVSVRSGARVSMPGMMDTILNLGINDEVAEGLATLTGNRRFAFDSYRRFIQMFSNVVMGVNMDLFEAVLEKAKEAKNTTKDTDLTAEDLEKIVKEYKKIYKKELKKEFPTDARDQMLEAIKAVFRSWNTPRAIVYRKMNDIPSNWGTAVNVQMMVFGNMGETSGTGVAFTRNPSTGENKLYGEYLMNAQGEDVVSGVRTPFPIAHLEEQNIDLYNQFVAICKKLEKHYKDMQDMEFTIENGKLYMLQTRNGKRTAVAALQIAIDMVNEGRISRKEALLKIDPRTLDSLLHPMFDADSLKKAKVDAKGLPASPGAGCGVVAMTSERAKQLHSEGKKVILVRKETSPEDIEGMSASMAVLTATGGMTSHAAVVARGMGTPCVAGCGELVVNEEKGTITANGKTLKEGDVISVDGSTGNVYFSEVKTVEAQISGNFKTIMDWAKEYGLVGVRANADNERDAKRALELGADGIGLCRTEHMFFEESRIKAFREMIVAQTVEAREKALAKVLPYQKSDFVSMFKALNGKSLTVRYLDPPLHEFLPKKDDEIKELAKTLGITFDELKQIVVDLHEFNPMMGFRGCRLSINMPEIAAMQTRAVIEAAIEVKKSGIDVHPEIMVPLVGDVKELKFVKEVIVKTADELIAKSGQDITYHVGTMIEIPRAALVADEIAKEADFFSFGTNDLTQMTFGFSRDDAGKFINDYYSKGILEADPFVKIDQNGVGKLMSNTVRLGRGVKPQLKIGICGEQGADPASIAFAHKLGITYVSCSPFRVPIAILASAQAAISAKR